MIAGFVRVRFWGDGAQTVVGAVDAKTLQAHEADCGDESGRQSSFRAAKLNVVA